MKKKHKYKLKNYKRFCISVSISIILLCLLVYGIFKMFSFIHGNVEVAGKVDTSVQASKKGSSEQVDNLSVLKQKINNQISKYNGEWQIYIKNLKTNQYISINSKPCKPASIIKLFNMMAFYNYINENNLIITKEQNNLLASMVTVSSNNASNSLVSIMGDGDFLKGAKYVTDYCKSQGFNDTVEEQRVYDEITAETIFTGENKVSVNDCGKALEQIYRGECVNEKYSKEMMDLLLAQYYRDKIPDQLPSGVKVAHKTGQTSEVNSDVGIVFSENCDYVICVLTVNATNSTSRIADLSKMIYDYFNNEK